MRKFLKELTLLIFIVVPYIYLATVWKQVPERVPTHFDIEGNANGWSSKTFLLYFPGMIGLSFYLLFLIIPVIDPKKKINQMGNKYYQFRLLLTIFNSLLVTYVLVAANRGRIENPNFIFIAVGLLFAVLGNYMQTIRPNYFIGLRTPWTLESEQVWKETHLMGGRLWMVGGILIVAFSLIELSERAFMISFGAILTIIIFVPIVFSYLNFQKEKRS